MYSGGVCCFFLLAPGVHSPRSRRDVVALLATVSAADVDLGNLLFSLVTPTDPNDRPDAVQVMASPVFENISTTMIIAKMQQAKRRADRIAPSAIMPNIDNEMGQEVKDSMVATVRVLFKLFFPYVAVSFATGHRQGKDTRGNGPGMTYAAVSVVVSLSVPVCCPCVLLPLVAISVAISRMYVFTRTANGAHADGPGHRVLHWAPHSSRQEYVTYACGFVDKRRTCVSDLDAPLTRGDFWHPHRMGRRVPAPPHPPN